MGGPFLEVFPVLWGGVVTRATGVFFSDMDVLAGQAICFSWSSWMCAMLSVSPSTRARCWMGLG